MHSCVGWLEKPIYSQWHLCVCALVGVNVSISAIDRNVAKLLLDNRSKIFHILFMAMFKLNWMTFHFSLSLSLSFSGILSLTHTDTLRRSIQNLCLPASDEHGHQTKKRNGETYGAKIVRICVTAQSKSRQFNPIWFCVYLLMSKVAGSHPRRISMELSVIRFFFFCYWATLCVDVDAAAPPVNRNRLRQAIELLKWIWII